MKDQAPLLAVLIDADNISAKHVNSIFAEITSFGEASVRRIYGDFSATTIKGWSKILADHAIVPIHQPANTVGKNASDIALVIDAMDLLHSGRVDGFVLVSSDSDFTRLASRVREHGLPVYGIGERKTPTAFIQSCRRFVFIENIGDAKADSDTNQNTKNSPSKTAQPKGADDQVHEASSITKEPPSKAVPLIRTAILSIETEDGWYNLGTVGQKLMANNPDFDSRTYGCPNLSTLLEKTGHFTVDRNATPLRVKRNLDGKNTA